LPLAPCRLLLAACYAIVPTPIGKGRAFGMAGAIVERRDDSLLRFSIFER
jgi:hypothetical protein